MKTKLLSGWGFVAVVVALSISPLAAQDIPPTPTPPPPPTILAPRTPLLSPSALAVAIVSYDMFDMRYATPQQVSQALSGWSTSAGGALLWAASLIGTTGNGPHHRSEGDGLYLKVESA